MTYEKAYSRNSAIEQCSGGKATCLMSGQAWKCWNIILRILQLTCKTVRRDNLQARQTCAFTVTDWTSGWKPLEKESHTVVQARELTSPYLFPPVPLESPTMAGECVEEDRTINLVHWRHLTKTSQAHNGMPIRHDEYQDGKQTILESLPLPTPRALWDNF